MIKNIEHNVGYVYMLKNNSYQKNVFKIGFTKNVPHERAKQIFSGATGVPEPFDVAIACQVLDYKRAEREIHAKLKAYRVSLRREFFLIPFEIGQKIIVQICNSINNEYGIIIDNPIYMSNKNSLDRDFDSQETTYLVRPQDLMPQEKIVSTLNKEQKDRVEVISLILEKVYNCTLPEWFDGFCKDDNPDKEIKIWEAIARAFSRADCVYSVSDALRKEMFALFLMRSWSKKTVVLEQHKSTQFTSEQLSEILDFYDLKPIPLTIFRRKTY